MLPNHFHSQAGRARPDQQQLCACHSSPPACTASCAAGSRPAQSSPAQWASKGSTQITQCSAMVHRRPPPCALNACCSADAAGPRLLPALLRTGRGLLAQQACTQVSIAACLTGGLLCALAGACRLRTGCSAGPSSPTPRWSPPRCARARPAPWPPPPAPAESAPAAAAVGTVETLVGLCRMSANAHLAQHKYARVATPHYHTRWC